ncbi:unnamed protein product [Amoebophrya sp. A120]|nr:unnamed protein product [Amoebophrya sp. A120]|eukprot:GSA120T00002236001.1
MLHAARRGLAAGRTTCSSTKFFGGRSFPAAGAAPLSGGAKRFYTSHPKEEDPTPLDVKYWTGKSAVPLDKFKIDASKYDLQKILSARDAEGKVIADQALRDTQLLQQHMAEIFQNVGAVQLVKTGLHEFEKMQAIVSLLFPEKTDYEGGANLRVEIEPNVYDTGAPKEADLQYHHEMAYIDASVKWLAFGALHATNNPLKGATYISENIGATERILETSFGQKLKDKGCCYVRKLPDQKFFTDNNLDSSIVYNFWQTSTGVEDMDQAAEIMRGKGLEVEWENSPLFGRYMVTKYYVDTFEYDPFNDKNTLYASVADDYAWFDSWPGVKELPHWERPLKLTFGDGEVMTRDEKQLWVDCYDQNGIPLLWEKGDIGIICNYRTAHGRPQYALSKGEKRELGVMLGETFKRQGELDGKW